MVSLRTLYQPGMLHRIQMNLLSEWRHYLTSYALKGRDDPSEHVKTNCVDIPGGIFNCIHKYIVKKQNKTFVYMKI